MCFVLSLLLPARCRLGGSSAASDVYKRHVSMVVSADLFLMAVAVGASCAFLTPIGHQCNALILGPGGYKFSDYWRMGLPLEILIVIVGTPLILHFWPF